VINFKLIRVTTNLCRSTFSPAAAITCDVLYKRLFETECFSTFTVVGFLSLVFQTEMNKGPFSLTQSDQTEPINCQSQPQLESNTVGISGTRWFVPSTDTSTKSSSVWLKDNFND